MKNKIRSIVIIAAICVAAGAGVFKIFISKPDTSVNAKINVTNSDIKSTTSKNNDNENVENSDKTDVSANSTGAGSDNNKNTDSSNKSDVKKSEVTAEKSNNEKSSNTEDKSSNENLKKLKSEYLAKLSEIEKQDKECGLESAKTTTDMKIAQGKRYTLWDNELNAIYSELKNYLSKDEMAKLEKEETLWIHVKEDNATNKAAEYKGGTFESVAKVESLVSDTKERCYYLVNNYM